MLRLTKLEKFMICFLVLLVVLPNVYARNFTVYNSTNPSQAYFTINGGTGRIGIGTAIPQNVLNVIGVGNFTENLYSNGAQVLTTATLNETDPYWSANFSLYNASWSSTYNSTYDVWAYNQTIPAINYANATFITKVNEANLNVNSSVYWNGVNSFSGLNNQVLSKWANITNAPTTLSFFTNDLGIGNWTLDKPNYYNSTQVNNLISSGTSNDTSNLGGHPASFFMPLNKSVYGRFDFNGGWTNNGLSIIDGNIYAQQGYFYKINALQVTNLDVNGSLTPDLDNQFDLGNSTYRWRDLNLGRNAVIGGTLTITGNLVVNTNNLFVDTSTGKVGIGTVSPKNELNVIGNINATKNLYGNLIYQDGKRVLDSLDNTTIYGYIDSQDTLYNNSMKAYVDSLNLSQVNWTIENYVPYNGSIKNTDLGEYNLSAKTINSNTVNTSSLQSDKVNTGTINVTGNAKITGAIMLGGANITANTNGDVNVW